MRMQAHMCMFIKYGACRAGVLLMRLQGLYNVLSWPQLQSAYTPTTCLRLPAPLS